MGMLDWVNPHRAKQKEMLYEELPQYGTAGLSEQQISQGISQDPERQAAIYKGVEQQMKMAGTPAQQGAYQETIGEIGSEDPGAAERERLRQQSAQIAQQRDADLQERLREQAIMTRENIETARQTGMEIYKTEKESAAAEMEMVAAMAAAAAGGSDIRLKEDIVRTGESPSGIPMYEFSYIGEPTRYRGAMAQDLLETHPHAVTIGSNGYYAVYYDQIDVPFEPIS